MAKKNDNTDVIEQGSWVSWADFLGTAGQGGMWSKRTLLKFLTEYRNNIISAESAELLIILQNAGLEYKIDTNEKFKKIILNPEDSPEREEAIDDNINELRTQLGIVGDDDDDEIVDNTTTSNGDVNVGEVSVSDSVDVEEEATIDLPKEKIMESMKLYDHEYIHLENLDAEKVRFLIENRINKLWNYVINERISPNDIKDDESKKYYTEIITAFRAEYDEVIQMQNPEGYCFAYQPSLMQKLIAYRLKTRKIYGNWSGVGAGKTLSGVYAGRYIGAKNTLIVTFNSTVSGWRDSLNAYFNDCIIYDKKIKDIKFEEGKNNYVVLNYEFFQQGQRSENLLYEFMEKNKIDYVILDEVHSVKQRDEDESMTIEEEAESGLLSNRRRLMLKFINDIKLKNPDTYLMVMTATPIINNLVEAKKLLELLHGRSYDEIGTNVRSVKSALEYHKHMVTNGIRYLPQYDIQCKTQEVEIDGSDLLFRLDGVTNDLHIEQIMLDSKLEGIRPYIRKNTIIYTYYVDVVVNQIDEYVKSLGFRTGLYTGRQSAEEREINKKAFQAGKIDILIGSAPIGTGVDGLQEICDRMILLSLPWTHSEYEQLIGRIFRQGSKFKTIDIIIPKVMVHYTDNEGEAKTWSRDRHKLNVIRFKRDLFGIVVNGIIPDGIVTDLATIKKMTIVSLNNIIEKVKSGEFGGDRDKIMQEFLQHSAIDEYRRKISAFGELNKKWNTRNSDKTFEEISKNAEEWHEYHRAYRAVRKEWELEETPFYVIAKKINKLNKSHYIVADFGCGDNLLCKEIQNKVLPFDMYAIDDTVTVADITKLPIADDSVHIGVFSLSLMGRNHKEALREAKRVVVNGGRLFVSEPLNRWENKEDGIDELKYEIESEGFEITNMHVSDKFVFVDAVNAL